MWSYETWILVWGPLEHGYWYVVLWNMDIGMGVLWNMDIL